MDRNALSFGVMCLIWGLTWVAVKMGLQAVPPFFFAGSRFLAAGVVIALVLSVRRRWHLRGSDVPRLLAVSLLMVGLTYGLLFWGMQFINTGTAALLELSFTPVALLGFALLLREEAFAWSRAAVILLGIAGLAILFGPKLSQGADPREAWGAAATVMAAIVYGLGSVLARPLIVNGGTWSVAAVTMVLGGAMLLGASVAWEPLSAATLRGEWGAAAWAGWLFLVAFGSLIGFTVYLRLLDTWGASKAGSFAFVSPVIAVLTGMLVYHEHVGAQEICGMVVMLTAAAAAVRTQSSLRPPPASSPQPRVQPT